MKPDKESYSMTLGSVDSRNQERTILGVRFFVGGSEAAVVRGRRGGLVVVPSAPMLLELARDPEYRAAATQADLVITDSGFMVVLWWLIKGEWLPRTSGLKYLRIMLQQEHRDCLTRTIWIMPSLSAARRLITWLASQGVTICLEHCYIAPHYPRGPVSDPDLLGFIHSREPSQVVVALGGGTQEKLGLYLKNQLGLSVGIHCIGAAIGFLTGDQVSIPGWADRFFLGWFLRCLSAPSRFIPRYWKSVSLGALLWRYQESSPTAQQ